MLTPLYLQNYKAKSEQGTLTFSIVGALPNEMPNIETEQYTWNFISHMILKDCSRKIVIHYNFKETVFLKDITFEDNLMGTIQYGSKVFNTRKYMKYDYNKESLNMIITISFPREVEIHGKEISWNIFINDRVTFGGSKS
jgi:hypothetical protein